MTEFAVIQNIIRKRRSTKPADMNGKKIDPSLIRELLALADWAPTHARTEPWRFMVYEKEAMQQFCADHAALYKTNTAEEKFTTGKYENLVHMADKASHIILVYMKRTEGATIPALEEIAAVSAAVENILLAATSLDIAMLWSTGGMIHHIAMKDYLTLLSGDIIMGLLYLGYSDAPVKEGKRNIPLDDKIVWKK